ncbi:hypothetical protein QKW60_13370 [Defluviimonas aestuarii]|uniref:hypothetical protein n=1 Tax=Albidovulum aestuarii TaxID=1130726 RepID=UPI00249BAC5A|nr:hypothetical protein [Defluviimonas aestuarii]MDI3337404.1 hypothetical protein [Defluviimonas aestuarii]
MTTKVAKAKTTVGKSAKSRTTKKLAPARRSAVAEAVQAHESTVETVASAQPTFDVEGFLKLFDDHIRRIYGELRQVTQELNASARLMALGPNRILDVPCGDYPFRFKLPYVGTDRVMNTMLMRRDFPKAENLASLANRLPKGGVFVDGGGFLGASSSYFSQILGADEIHVFEPQRIILPTLEENLAMNEVKGLHLHKAALMDEEAAVAPGTFRPREIYNTPFLKHKEGTYKGMSIDGLNLSRLDVIHLDFHGPKILALKGALKSIEKHKPFIAIDVEGRDQAEVTEFLEPMGYDIAGLPTSFLYYPKA